MLNYAIKKSKITYVDDMLIYSTSINFVHCTSINCIVDILYQKQFNYIIIQYLTKT